MNKTAYTYLPSSTLDSLKNIELVARSLVEGGMLGLHRSPYRGFSSEFSEYRKYSSGDDVRHIDWKTYARSDRHYIKCFEEDSNLNSYILLDTSNSMTMQNDGAESPAKFNYACYLAAAFMYLAHKQHDAFGLYTWAEQVDNFEGCSNSLSHLTSQLKRLEKLKPGGESDSEKCLSRIAELIPQRSLVLIFSDFLDRNENFIKPLHHLDFKKCEVILFQVMTENELKFPYRGLVRFEDLETAENIEVESESCRSYYLEALRNYNHRLRMFTEHHRMVFETISTATPFESALLAYFSKRTAMY
ncbi:MAG: DUF58 domain-containing protein [Victivallaceae bacterium]